MHAASGKGDGRAVPRGLGPSSSSATLWPNDLGNVSYLTCTSVPPSIKPGAVCSVSCRACGGRCVRTSQNSCRIRPRLAVFSLCAGTGPGLLYALSSRVGRERRSSVLASLRAGKWAVAPSAREAFSNTDECWVVVCTPP